MAALQERLQRWWRHTVWEEDGAPRSRLTGFFLPHLRAWETAGRSFGRDNIDMRAHALTFRTLLSLVPLLAVAFSLFQAFGGLEASQRALQGLVTRNLAPGSAAEAMQHVRTFVGRVSAGAVGGVGVVVLFFTVVSLLTSLEQSFNALWNVARVRRFASRFITYWAMVTVGPVLLAVSVSMTSAAQSHSLMERLDALLPGSRHLGMGLAPWLMTCTGMTLLYMIVPNTRVRWRSALGGGLVAGTLWELGKVGFAWASAGLFRYNAVYGSFGALPVFLLWLQTGWMVVLLGCKVSYALQHARALREERRPIEVGPVGREFLALRTMIAVARAHALGSPPPTAETLATGAASVLGTEREVLDRLVGARLLHAVAAAGDGEEGPEGYVPARDPSAITLQQILDVFRHAGATPAELGTEEPSGELARRVIEEGEQAAAAAAGALTLAEAVSRLDAESTAAGRLDTAGEAAST